MPFNRPTLQEVVDRIESDFQSRVEGSTTFLRRSVFKIFSRVFGGAEHLLYDYLQFMKDQLFILTSDAEHLEKHGSEYGITRNYGTRSSGNAIFSGTNGISIPAGTKIQSADGKLYSTTAAGTISGGTATIAITADDVGNDYDQSATTTLSFVSAISGVSTDAIVDSSGLTGGVDEESDEEYRARILDRKRYPPHGGTENDYIVSAKEYSGVTRAWTIPEYQGIGTIGLVFVRDDESDIFPDETVRNAVRAYMLSHTDPITGKTVGIPVTAEPGFFIIAAEAKTVDLTIQIYPNNSAVQAAVTTKIEEMIIQYGGPAETIYLSQLYEAITSASGEVKSRIIYPASDIAAAVDEVHVLGTITWEEYV